jgi:CRISPR system Cascade subunit CasE
MKMTRIMLRRVPPPNIIHGILSAAFPGIRNKNANECIWRIDKISDGMTLLLVSVGSPNRSHIESEIGRRGDARNKTLDYEPFLAKVENSQTWGFRLCANPVGHSKIPQGKRGKVYALRSESEQLEWLDRQGEKYGFRINGCSVTNDELMTFYGTDKGSGKNAVCIKSVTFDGMLTVTDAEAFRTALTGGIGRGKAYGCGLLTIAKVQA